MPISESTLGGVTSRHRLVLPALCFLRRGDSKKDMEHANA